MRKFLPALLALCAFVAPLSAASLNPGATVSPTSLSSFKVGPPGADATVYALAETASVAETIWAAPLIGC